MIGIFDSGSGGLSVLKQIKAQAPKLDIYYFGDVKHMPYGNRSREELGALTVLCVQKLLRAGTRNIVSACNSVSANIVLPIGDILGVAPFEIVEMVEPTARDLSSPKGKKVVVVGTQATVDSGIYQEGFKKHGVHVEQIAVPELAAAIEFDKPEPTLRLIIDEAVNQIIVFTPDVVVLGCTQFPLVKEIFEQSLKQHGSTAAVYDPAEAVAREAISRFGTEGSGKLQFVLSADSEHFRKRVVELFPGQDYTIEVG